MDTVSADTRTPRKKLLRARSAAELHMARRRTPRAATPLPALAVILSSLGLWAAIWWVAASLVSLWRW